MNLRPPEQPLETSRARDCLLTNLLVLPGMGSVMAGRRVGYLQACLALGGLVLSLMFAVSLVRTWWLTQALALPSARELALGGLGVGVFLAGWLWALATGLRLVREAKGPGSTSAAGAKPPIQR